MSGWKTDDIAVVVQSIARARKAPIEEVWLARLVAPSAFGEGWWIVRKLNPESGRASGAYTVPESELRKR